MKKIDIKTKFLANNRARMKLFDALVNTQWRLNHGTRQERRDELELAKTNFLQERQSFYRARDAWVQSGWDSLGIASTLPLRDLELSEDVLDIPDELTLPEELDWSDYFDAFYKLSTLVSNRCEPMSASSASELQKLVGELRQGVIFYCLARIHSLSQRSHSDVFTRLNDIRDQATLMNGLLATILEDVEAVRGFELVENDATSRDFVEVNSPLSSRFGFVLNLVTYLKGFVWGPSESASLQPSHETDAVEVLEEHRFDPLNTQGVVVVVQRGTREEAYDYFGEMGTPRAAPR